MAGKKGEQRNKLIGSAYGDLQQLLLAQLINAIEDLAVNLGKIQRRNQRIFRITYSILRIHNCISITNIFFCI